MFTVKLYYNFTAVVLGCHSDKDCTNMCKHDGNLLDGNCVHGVCHCDHAIIAKYVILFIRKYTSK